MASIYFSISSIELSVTRLSTSHSHRNISPEICDSRVCFTNIVLFLSYILRDWRRTSDGQVYFSVFNEILTVSLMYHYEVKIEYMNVY